MWIVGLFQICLEAAICIWKRICRQNNFFIIQGWILSVHPSAAAAGIIKFPVLAVPKECKLHLSQKIYFPLVLARVYVLYLDWKSQKTTKLAMSRGFKCHSCLRAKFTIYQTERFVSKGGLKWASLAIDWNKPASEELLLSSILFLLRKVLLLLPDKGKRLKKELKPLALVCYS